MNLEPENPPLSTGGADNAPIILVGQPRSGSTLFTRILNEHPDLFLINDLYVLQRIDTAGLWGRLTPEEARQIARWVFDKIEIRATQRIGINLIHSIHMTEGQLSELKGFVERDWSDTESWCDVLDSVMAEAARIAGCRRWGYNTPQDHLHLDRLLAAFPNAKVAFLLRNLSAVMRSYKNLVKRFHNPGRYNPVTVAIAWKAASMAYERWVAAFPAHVRLYRYEDMVGDTDAFLDDLGTFVGETMPAMDIAAFGKNTSHSADSPNKPVTPTEVWVAERVVGASLGRLGFENKRGRLRLRDLGELVGPFVKSAGHFLHLAVTNPNRRRRILRFVQNTLFTRGRGEAPRGKGESLRRAPAPLNR